VRAISVLSVLRFVVVLILRSFAPTFLDGQVSFIAKLEAGVRAQRPRDDRYRAAIVTRARSASPPRRVTLIECRMPIGR
jgi:hypothetical protein